MRWGSEIAGIGEPKCMLGASNFVAKRVLCEEVVTAGFASALHQYDIAINFHDWLHNASKW